VGRIRPKERRLLRTLTRLNFDSAYLQIPAGRSTFPIE
jgi:hypothetical protein